jgi:hypothetical protein
MEEGDAMEEKRRENFFWNPFGWRLPLGLLNTDVGNKSE